MKEHCSSCRSGDEILNDEVSLEDGINAIDWDEEGMREGLEIALHTGTQFYFCGEGGSVRF